jgi:hypothetical protein
VRGNGGKERKERERRVEAKRVERDSQNFPVSTRKVFS